VTVTVQVAAAFGDSEFGAQLMESFVEFAADAPAAIASARAAGTMSVATRRDERVHAARAT
jgi:hypothetical protein